MGVLVIGTITADGRLRRLFALALALVVLLLPVALPPANAEPDYPASFYKISASSFTARVGTSIDFKAETFASGSAVSYSVTAAGAAVTSGSTTADAKGVARQSITFTVVGANKLTMSGTSDKGSPLTLSANIKVTADDAGNGGTATGDNNPGASSSNGSSDPVTSDSGGVPFFGGGLPRTGGEIALTVLIGLALIGGGAALVVAARNRRTS